MENDAPVLIEVPTSGVRAAYSQMLQKQLYALFTSLTNGPEPAFARLEERLAFQVELEREGTMFAADHRWTDNEQHGRGEAMVVVRTGSADEAKTIAERDPMHAPEPVPFRSCWSRSQTS